MELKSHWEQIYTTKDSAQVSWYKPHLDLSLQMIERTGVEKEAQIIDVGGGASTLVDDLLANDYPNVTVLDISRASMQVAQNRLGSQAGKVTWLEADITQATLPEDYYDIWHDRAVFHFLTNVGERKRYVQAMTAALKPAGHVVMATFSLRGPPRCSGLEVVRYSPSTLQAEMGTGFRLLESIDEEHRTPFDTTQNFVYCRFQKT